MTIAAHIIFSTAGIIGAYIWTALFLFTYQNAEVTLLASIFLGIGKWSTVVGTVGVVISGATLFVKDSQTFLHSKKFISNMIAMAVLLVVEVLSFTTHGSLLGAFLITIAFLWTVIFLVALFVPR